MKPTKSILSKEFTYVPARLTDLKKTFARIKREQKVTKVIPILKIQRGR